MKKLLLILLSTVSLNALAVDYKVLTWNVFMLPKPIKFTYQAERTRHITDVLDQSEYDLIFLQEAFPGSFHSHVYDVTKKKYPHQYYLGRPLISHTVFGSGLYLMSRYPVKSRSKAYYKDCRGADCFAAKGVILVTIVLPGGKEIQIANTHLQAGGDPKGSRIRLRQVEQIRKLLHSESKPGVPQILLGDINIDAKHQDFARALELLNMKTSALTGDLDYTNGYPIACYNKPGSDEKEWIDHILISKNSDAKVKNRKVRTFSAKIDQRECPLSDHYAVEAIISL